MYQLEIFKTYGNHEPAYSPRITKGTPLGVWDCTHARESLSTFTKYKTVTLKRNIHSFIILSSRLCFSNNRLISDDD